MRRTTPFWILLLLLTASFTLATVLQPRMAPGNQNSDSDGLLKVVLGDSRRLFADQFLEQADVSFHSGYYPSIFDERQAPKDTRHMAAEEGSAEAEAHEKNMNFLGPPRDWIEKFGRNFLITEHSHLEGGNEREILPWLRISAELNPHRVDTYSVAAYWLRHSLGKVAEAEQFLRDGIRNNPNSYELWYELGLIYNENHHDVPHARNTWELALRYWQEQESSKTEPDLIGFEKIVIHLGDLEQRSSNLERAIGYFKMALKSSPNPNVLRQQIGELEQKVAANHGTNSSGAHGR